ncbi:MAG: dihydropyrimidinase [Ilumatobacteraceae bacterium]|nr:dihydropyrimidinase [Ilumatobacteraceae bacterium]MDP5068020.1 dihydropyrimidinase [Ilumatobacteraceae bacterium]
MRTIVVNGTVINAEGRVAADVVIEGERIVSVVPRSANAVVPGPDDTVIDATGCFVIPGGVDAHVHMQLDTGTTVSSDSFESGTIAAAHGGTTTIIDFAEQRLGGQVLTSFEQRFAEAESQCVIDWGLHQVLGGVDAQALIDTRSLVEREGVASIKLFMAYPGRLYSDDGQILRALQMCADTGMMAMVHAENGLAIDVLIEQAVAAGNTGPEFHSLTRPPELEAEAVHRAAVLARVAGNAPLYIVHLSSSHALREVVEARSRGTNIFAETCPQYLHLSLEEHLGQGWPNGAGFICSTPLRSRHDHHQADLWEGLRIDQLAVVSTDHCPFCLREQKLANGEAFNVVPNGIGGVEHRMDLVYQGVVAGHISEERWVEVCATAPARLFGLGAKGVLAQGFDADVVIYDPNATSVIGAATHHMNLDYSAYEGVSVQGGVRTVLSRGEVIVNNGTFLGRVGRGKYLRRDVSRHIR